MTNNGKLYVAIFAGLVAFVVVIALWALMQPADAKTKTANARIAESFQTLPPQILARERAIAMLPQKLWFKPPPHYIADRPVFSTFGKGFIYRECEVDIKQDPGEHSCRMVFAWI